MSGNPRLFNKLVREFGTLFLSKSISSINSLLNCFLGYFSKISFLKETGSLYRPSLITSHDAPYCNSVVSAGSE